MWDTFTLFSSSYAATLAMGLVCAYLGVFCVLRRIVFTGVALAQLAAGGVAISFFVADLGLGAISGFAAAYGATWGSLAASLAGLLGLQARRRQGRITEDALVGLAYSAAGALAILLVWRSSRGLTELQNILAGTVLLPQKSELVSLWIGLGIVALVHAVFRRELLLVSYDPEFARAAGVPEHRYQLLFLATLAVAVALALKAGGLMLVFAFLVVPPLAGLSLGERLGEAMLYALAVAAGGSLLGFLCSIGMDWPVGPSVAMCLVLLLGLSLLGGVNAQLQSAARAVTLALGALAVLAGPAALVAAPAPAGGSDVVERSANVNDQPAVAEADDDDDDENGAGEHHAGEEVHEETFEEVLAELNNGDAAARVTAIPELAAFGPEAFEPLLEIILDPDPAVRDAVDAGLVEVLDDPAAADELMRLLGDQSAPPLARARAAVAATRLGFERGPLAIVDVLAAAQDDLPFLVQDEAVALLRGLRGGKGFGYDAFESVAVNADALAAWRGFLQESKDTASKQIAASVSEPASTDSTGVVGVTGAAGPSGAEVAGARPGEAAASRTGSSAPADWAPREPTDATQTVAGRGEIAIEGRDLSDTDNPPPVEPSPQGLAESAAQRLRDGPDRADAARELFTLGLIGKAVLDEVIADGPIDAARASLMVLSDAEQADRLRSGELPAALRLDVARNLLDAWQPFVPWSPSAALDELAAPAQPDPGDMERVLRAYDYPNAQRVWMALVEEEVDEASALVERWLVSSDLPQQRAAAAALATLPQPTATVTAALASSKAGPAPDRMVQLLANNVDMAIFAALRARFDKVGPEAQVALLRRIGRELDEAGWPLVGQGQTASDPEVRRAAREALVEFRMARDARAEWEALQARDVEDRLVDQLCEQLRTAESGKVATAAQALADLGAQRAIPDLVAALESADPELQAVLRDALRQLRLQGTELL